MKLNEHQVDDERGNLGSRPSSAFAFAKRNWSIFSKVLGFLLTVLSLFSSYYFYTLSEKNREPVLLETHNLRIFSSPSGITSDLFALVTKPDMKEISKNVYLNEVVFWNNGRLAIKKENVLKDIKIKYPEGVEIMDVYLKSSTRPEVTQVSVSHAKGGREVNLEFDILEEKDGFKLQVIYLSEQKALLDIVGSIEGVPAFLTDEDMARDKIWQGLGKSVMWVFLSIVGFVAFGFIVFGIIWFSENYLPNYITKYFFPSFLILMFCFFVFVLYASVLDNAKGEGRRSIPEMEDMVLPDN